MRRVIIITTVIAVMLTLGFGIVWKECDMIWWFYAPWDIAHTALWVDVQFDLPTYDFGNWSWATIQVVWQINLYNSWCLFMTLEVLCFAGVIITLLAGVLWYYLRPEAMYIAHPTKTTMFLVSRDRGKSWIEEKFEKVK